MSGIEGDEIVIDGVMVWFVVIEITLKQVICIVSVYMQFIHSFWRDGG